MSGLQKKGRGEELTPNVTPHIIRLGAKDVKVGKASEKNFSVAEAVITHSGNQEVIRLPSRETNRLREYMLKW